MCAMSSHAMAFDNVSRVGIDISDGLCSLATGGGRRARKFYTESEAVLFRFARPLILTSIVEAVTEGDLLDRSIIIRAPKAVRRKADEQLATAFAELHPRLLGAICFLVSVAIKNVDTVVVPDDVRMQSAAAFAAAAEQAAGFPAGAVFDVYRQAQDDARAVTAEQPVARAILDWAGEPTFGPPDMKWSGTATNLRDILTERVCGLDDKGRLLKREPKGWPADAKGLGSALRRLAPTLSDLGVEIEFGSEGTGKAKQRIVRVTKRDAEASESWDATVDREIAEKMALGTHGTHGTQNSTASFGSASEHEERGSVSTAGGASLSLFPQEREASVPSVPSVPSTGFIEQDAGRKPQPSVPSVPRVSVPRASHALAAPRGPSVEGEWSSALDLSPSAAAEPFGGATFETDSAGSHSRRSASEPDLPYGVLSAPLRARAVGARAEPSAFCEPGGEYPHGWQLVIEVETEAGPAVYVQPLHPIFSDKTLEQVTRFGGEKQADGSYILHPAELVVQVCRHMILGIGDVLEVATVDMIEEAVA